MVTKNMGLLIGSKTVRWVQKGIMYCTATARHTKQKWVAYFLLGEALEIVHA
jgi:hypothetical protein